MDKLAQRRGKIDKLKEKLNPLNLGGKLMENFSPEFAELMDKLRDVDDKIREIVTGDGETLKDMIKVAKTNFNRREYMTAITFLGRFHDKLEAVDREISHLENTVDAKHYEFLFGDVDPGDLKYLTEDMGGKFEKARKTPTGIVTSASLDKEAGMADWWHNIRSDRGKALAAWEKRFPKYAKDLKNQTGLMINRSESLVNYLLASLKAMNSLRDARKLEEYIKVAKKLQDKFKQYNVSFISFYNLYVKKFIEYQKSIQSVSLAPGEAAGLMTKPLFDSMLDGEGGPDSVPPTDPSGGGSSSEAPPSSETTPDSKLPGFSIAPPSGVPSVQTGPNDFPTPIVQSKKPTTPPPAAVRAPVLDSLSLLPEAPSYPTPAFDFMAIPASSLPPSRKTEAPLDLKNPSIPKPPLLPQEFSQTLPSPGAARRSTLPWPGAADHSAFLKSLATFENEHPMIVAKEIIRYAKSIEKTDIETSKRLLGIAQRVLKG